MPVVQEMTKTQFESVYDYDLTDGGMTYITTVYGWPATVTAAGNNVVITNMPEQGQTYTYTPGGVVSDGEEEDEEAGHSFGTTTFAVTGNSNGEIVYNIAFNDTVSVGDNGAIQMIELDFGNETWFVTNVNGGDFTYKTCDETSNAVLYFEIEIVSIE